MSDLLKAAADSPLLLTFLVVLGGAVWAVEKLGGVDGPLTRLYRAWRDRELRKLRREREQVIARRQLDDARVADLESEVEYLRALLDAARAVPAPRDARNSARATAPGS